MSLLCEGVSRGFAAFSDASGKLEQVGVKHLCEVNGVFGVFFRNRPWAVSRIVSNVAYFMRPFGKGGCNNVLLGKEINFLLQIISLGLEKIHGGFQGCACHKRGGFVIPIFQTGNCFKEIRGNLFRCEFWSFSHVRLWVNTFNIVKSKIVRIANMHVTSFTAYSVPTISTIIEKYGRSRIHHFSGRAKVKSYIMPRAIWTLRENYYGDPVV